MKLHLGGKQVKEGWTILNAIDSPGVDIVGDILDLTQFEDGVCEAIYASHILEHIPQALVIQTLAEIARILETGGKFYCSVPDLETLSRLLINDLLSTDQKFHVMRMMFGGQTDSYDFHYVGYTWAFFTEIFSSQAGFKTITRVTDFGIFDDASSYRPYGDIPISLNFICEK